MLRYQRPVENGEIVDWELQQNVWNRVFSKQEIDAKARETTLMFLEPPMNRFGKNLEEIFFEEFEFHSLNRSICGTHAHLGYSLENPSESSILPCSLVVDAGYTCTHIIPVFENQPILGAITRFDVGGQHLTAYLRDLLWQTPLDTQHVNDIKEKLCYVASDFNEDLLVTMSHNQLNNYIAKQYILHPARSALVGRTWDKGDNFNPSLPYVEVSSERFRVPEALFDATKVGKPAGSIVDAILKSISLCPEPLRDAMFSNIICMGGTMRIPNIVNRLQNELSSRIAPGLKLNIHISLEPNGLAWRGAVDFVNTSGDDFVPNYCVLREEYLESGHRAGKQKFFV